MKPLRKPNLYVRLAKIESDWTPHFEKCAQIKARIQKLFAEAEQIQDRCPDGASVELSAKDQDTLYRAKKVQEMLDTAARQARVASSGRALWK